MQFPNAVESTESIARYLLENSKFSAVNMRVYYSAFTPAKDSVMSAYRVTAMHHDEILELGSNYVATPQGKEVKAYAVVSARVIEAQSLQMIPTLQPHPRHVDVVGWTEKEANRSKAQIIAEHAKLVLK